ncbi:uncharacterized protein LOC126984049, partial [Eriocheir sinensis]|uniref:uncharacterized protein LOC126984049 n=1 Tax=Eriocheir sinensis TaxID=95602 RepID=UPI0021C86956
MAGRSLLPLLRLVFLVIALEASSLSSSYTSTHRSSLSSWSPSLHSRVNGSTINSYKMKRELPNASDSDQGRGEKLDNDPGPMEMPCKDGHPGLPSFKDPPHVKSITEKTATVFIYPFTTQDYIEDMFNGSQFSYVLQFWEDGSSRLNEENRTFEGTWRGYTYTFSGLTPDTTYTFSGLTTNSGNWVSGITVNTGYRFSGLTPSTNYHVQALVKVTVGGKTCTADMKEVMASTFTTCPEPLVPEGLSATSYSSTSIAVEWSPVSYPWECDLPYRLTVEEKWGNNRSIKEHVTEEVYDVINNLQPYTDYLVMVQSKSGGKYSDITNTTVKTRPSKPGKVTGLRKVEANGTSLLVTWDHPQDNPPKG